AKADLYAAAVQSALEQPLYMRGIAPDCDQADVARRVIHSYLSQDHSDNVDEGCALVALPSDVARSDPAVKRVFQAGFKAIADVLALGLDRGAAPGAHGERALAMAAMCVGGVVVARAIEDAVLAESVRSAVLKVALDLGGLKPSRQRRQQRCS